MSRAGNSTVGRQTWALIRRYCINERRSPFLFLFKFIIWPTLWMWLFYKFVILAEKGRHEKRAFVAGLEKDENIKNAQELLIKAGDGINLNNTEDLLNNLRDIPGMTDEFLNNLKDTPLTTNTEDVLGQLENISKNLEQVPIKEPTFNGYGEGIEPYLSLLLILTVSLHLYYYVVYMVTDKSSGMKSLMLSVGLRRVSYYLANCLCFIASVLPLVVFFATLTSIHLFEDSRAASSLTIFTIFTLFTLHLSGLVLVFNALIQVPSLAGIILIAAVLEYFTHEHMWLRLAETAPGTVLFLASSDPYESIKLFGESYRHCNNEGLTMARGKLGCVSTSRLMIAMLFWTLFSYAFGIWFDQACPWQTDTANRGLLYCFRWFDSGSEKQPDLELDQRSTLNGGSKLFEKSASSHKVGISIKNVSKEFSGKNVLEDINFEVYSGETTLLLGHNGAGKTTLMNIILGKLMANQGRVFMERHNEISGEDNGVGVCPQTSVLDTFLSVRQHLELFSDIKNYLGGEIREKDINNTLFDVSLDRKVDSLPSELSGGMKRKLSLGMAFVGKSSILILDEPSSGLDPDSRVFVWNAIRRYRADRTVLLSTQHMEEADYLGDRIAIMSRGKIICCGSSVFLTKAFGSGYKLRVECLESKRQSIIELARKYFKKVKQSDNEHAVRLPGSKELILDMVLELNDSKQEKIEKNLIKLLEQIEQSGSQLGIKSHGLRSSSIEDVLLNTAKLDTAERNGVKQTSSSPKDHIATLVNPLTVHGSSVFFERKAIFRALMRKHFCTYGNDWKSLIVFRVIIVGLVMWRLSADVDGEMWGIQYSPTFISFALIFHTIHYPILERVSGFKTMQMTSSANLTLYWASQLAIDMLGVLLITGLVSFCTWDTFDSTGRLLAIGGSLLFGLAGLLNCYVLSTLFRESGSALAIVAMYFLLGNIVTQLIVPIWGLIFDSVERTRDFGRELEMIGVILFPTDAFRYILHGIISTKHYSIGPDNYPPVMLLEDKLPPLLAGFCALVGQTLTFGALLCVIEYHSLDPSTWASTFWLRFKALCFSTTKEEQNQQEADIDEDVVGENRVAESSIMKVSLDEFSLVASNLSKSYIPGVRAVDQLSFAVHKGECFGLLGVNGAGKSTTFSMLVAERRPDSGRIRVESQFSDRNKSAYLQKLGYDPQLNPVMSLTPEQALFFMARLRRVNEETIPSLVNSVLEVLDMRIHAHKSCQELSGGTMRKLALGMSLIGNPKLLALDEPTAGVDPVARRSIWQLLRDLRSRKNISIIISSHAMEECEAICDRISIMARGRLRCIGSFLHLRNKFSQGCTVRIQFSPSENLNNFATKIVPELANRLWSFVGETVSLADTNINSATYNISTSDFKHSALLKLLRDFKQQHPSITYMVNDSSLEDIFINMAQEQEQQQANHHVQFPIVPESTRL